MVDQVPPTPENAYVVVHNALAQVNQTVSPEYKVAILCQIVDKQVIGGNTIRENQTCDPSEPVMLAIVHKVPPPNTWYNWFRSFFHDVSKKRGAQLGSINVITSREGNELRKVDFVAQKIMAQIQDYKNPNDFHHLGNGTLIRKKGAENLKVQDGKLFIDNMPVDVPASDMFAEEPMEFKCLDDGKMSLGSPSDTPFYFHTDELTENGELKLFRKPDLSC